MRNKSVNIPEALQQCPACNKCLGKYELISCNVRYESSEREFYGRRFEQCFPLFLSC